MTKTAVISIDLASMAGTLKYVPGPQLPRHDKRLLERGIANSFLTHLSKHDGSTIVDVESNANDPPDVIFNYNGQHRGIELSELVPENRFEKDSIIRRLRRDIVSRLVLGEATAGFVVTIFLADAYSTRMRPGRIGSILAEALNGFFNQADTSIGFVEVPVKIQNVVSRISVFREDLTGDPRIGNDHEPLIIFDAQHTMLIPEDDCPAIVKSRLSRKELHDLSCPTWLILWSNHHALVSLRNELDNAIGNHLRSCCMNYERIFHLHFFAGSGATEFPLQQSSVGITAE